MATLLLADDSVTIQRVMELTFANELMRVVTASDGHAATAALDAERPDIVLVDAGLPGVDGYTLAERLKRDPATATTPVLLLTGAFEPIDEARARRCGCNGVLVKPFEPHRVVALVKALLAGQTPDDLWPDDLTRFDSAGHTPDAAPSTEPAPAAMDAVFEIGLDDLDTAFSQLDPVAPAVPPLVAEDVESPGRGADAAAINIDGLDWDLPAAPATRSDAVNLPVLSTPWTPPPAVATPSPASAPAEPRPASPEPEPPPALTAPTVAEAFSALLAAEQSQAASTQPATTELSSSDPTDATIEAVVRRVAARVTAEMDRLVREELERLKR